MQFVYFLLLPSALLSIPLSHFHQEVTNRESLSTALVYTWLVIGCFVLASRWLERARIDFSRSFDDSTARTKPPRWLRNRHSLLVWVWCILQPICLAATGWTHWIQIGIAESSFRAIQLTAMMMPSVLMIGLVEFNACSISRRALRLREGLLTHWTVCMRHAWRNAVMTWLFPIALPVFIAIVPESISLLGFDLSKHGTLRALACLAVSCITSTLIVPHLFVWLLQAKSVDPSIESLVSRAWKSDAAGKPKVLQWETGCRSANAAVVGMFRYGRKLLLTDALLQRLTDDEISLVVLHERAHCARYHAWIRLVPTLTTVLFLVLSMTIFQGVVLSAACLILLGLFALSLIGVCWWSEFDADRYAIRLAVQLNHAEEALADLPNRRVQYGNHLVSALQKIYTTASKSKGSWLHPSCDRRIGAIENFIRVDRPQDDLSHWVPSV